MHSDQTPKKSDGVDSVDPPLPAQRMTARKTDQRCTWGGDDRVGKEFGQVVETDIDMRTDIEK